METAQVSLGSYAGERRKLFRIISDRTKKKALVRRERKLDGGRERERERKNDRKSLGRS